MDVLVALDIGGTKLLAAASSNLKLVPVPRIEPSVLGYETALRGGILLAAGGADR